MSLLKLEPQLANSSANFAFGNVFASNFYYANGTLFSGGGSGTVKYTAATTPPSSNNSPGDQWFNTTAQKLYEYINDGTGNYWVDILTPTISSASLNGSMVSGNSNVIVNANGNITLSASGTTNVVVVSNTATSVLGNVSVTGNLSVSGNISGNVSLSNVNVVGYTTTSNGFYSVNTYNGSFTDGVVVDYLTGNGRISVGTADGLQVYNGGVASNLIFSITPTGNTAITNNLTVANAATVTGNLSAGNTVINGTLLVTSAFTMQQTYEVVNSVNGATGTVAYDFTVGGTYYHTNPAAAWTANITNIPSTANRIFVIVFIVNQGTTGYLPSAYQINGTAVTVKWTASPTASTSKYDVLSLSCMYVGGSWLVFGQNSSFS